MRARQVAALGSLERLRQPVIYKERNRRPLVLGSTVSPVRGFCDSVFRDQHGNPTHQEPTWDEESGKLGVYWYNPDGSVLQFHDDYW